MAPLTHPFSGQSHGNTAACSHVHALHLGPALSVSLTQVQHCGISLTSVPRAALTCARTACLPLLPSLLLLLPQIDLCHSPFWISRCCHRWPRWCQIWWEWERWQFVWTFWLVPYLFFSGLPPVSLDLSLLWLGVRDALLPASASLPTWQLGNNLKTLLDLKFKLWQIHKHICEELHNNK